MTLLIKKFVRNLGYGVKMYYLKEPTDDYSGIAISTGDEGEIDLIVKARNSYTDLLSALKQSRKDFSGLAMALTAQGDFDNTIALIWERVKEIDAALIKAGVNDL